MGDNREMMEYLMTESLIKVPSDFIIAFHIERAPDRRDTVNVFKITGIPTSMTELILRQLIAHHAGTDPKNVDYIFHPKNHITGEPADYSYGKALNIEAYDKIIELSFRVLNYNGVEIIIHDITEEKKGKMKQQRMQQITAPYKPTFNNKNNNNNNNNLNYLNEQRRISYDGARNSPHSSYAAALTTLAQATGSAFFTPSVGTQMTTNTTTPSTTTQTADTYPVYFAPQAGPMPNSFRPVASITPFPTQVEQTSVLAQIFTSLKGMKKDFRAEINQLRSEFYDKQEKDYNSPVLPSPYSVLGDATARNTPDANMADASQDSDKNDEVTLNKKQKTNV